MPTSFSFLPGQPWRDTDGALIEAHGGGILLHAGLYWWYGENHALGEGNKTGISVYSSPDLQAWTHRGVCLPKAAMPEAFRDTGVVERPKVLFNARTGKFVMWMHLDAEGYTVASAGVAVADRPEGPFVFLGAQRPIAHDYGCDPAVAAQAGTRESERGNTFRDMALFQDDEGTAYVFYASENNATLYGARLNDDFTDIERPAVLGQTWQRLMPFAYREAPAPFRWRGRYVMITSGLTGWSPNPAEYAVADHPLGPWTRLGNPCIGPEADTTFRSQSTYVLPAPGGTEDDYIYLGDRWVGGDLVQSTHVWLPFRMRTDGSLRLQFLDSWGLSLFEQPAGSVPAAPAGVAIEAEAGGGLALRWEASPGAAVYRILRNGTILGTTTATHSMLPPELAGQAFAYSVVAANLAGDLSEASAPAVHAWTEALPVRLSRIRPAQHRQGWGPLERDRAIHGTPLTIAGRVFSHGLGTHAPAETVFPTCGRYATFRCWVGVDSYPSFSDASSVTFEVWGDGRCLAQTPVLRVRDAAVRLEVDIRGVGELRLVVTDAGDGAHFDHANWAEAELLP